MTIVTRQQVTLLLEEPLETQYATVARLARQPFGPQESLSQQIQRGQAIADQLAAALQNRICNEWECCAKLNDPRFQDDVELAASVADAIAGLCGVFPPAVIAVILLKRGLKSLCSCG